jgi:hypothetical protein
MRASVRCRVTSAPMIPHSIDIIEKREEILLISLSQDSILYPNMLRKSVETK